MKSVLLQLELQCQFRNIQQQKKHKKVNNADTDRYQQSAYESQQW